MECSWKTVLLLVCASLGVQYTAIRTLSDTLPGPCQGSLNCHARQPRGNEPPWPEGRQGEGVGSPHGADPWLGLYALCVM